jgi:hypothetical protein
MPTRKKSTKKQLPKRVIKTMSLARLYELRNTSSSDYELIVKDNGVVQHFWMTPNKTIRIPVGPLTPQIEEFKRRQMLSVTEVTT